MGRKPLLRPTSSLDVHFDAELRTRLDLLLWSEAEGRVPKGAYQRVFNALLTQFLDHKTLDLSPYLGTLPGEATVRGHPMTLERLVEALERISSQTEAAAAAERERCARLCEAEAAKWRGEQDITDFKLCASMIREGKK